MIPSLLINFKYGPTASEMIRDLQHLKSAETFLYAQPILHSQ